MAEVTDPARRALQLQGHITSFQNSISALQRCRYPVIVATHGVAYGLSIDIMAACDIRYAASNTIFSIKVISISPNSLTSHPSSITIASSLRFPLSPPSLLV